MAPPACCCKTAAFDPNLDSAPFADPAILKKTDFPGTNTGRVPNSGVRSYFGFCTFIKLLAPPACCGKTAALDPSLDSAPFVGPAILKKIDLKWHNIVCNYT